MAASVGFKAVRKFEFSNLQVQDSGPFSVHNFTLKKMKTPKMEKTLEITPKPVQISKTIFFEQTFKSQTSTPPSKNPLSTNRQPTIPPPNPVYTKHDISKTRQIQDHRLSVLAENCDKWQLFKSQAAQVSHGLSARSDIAHQTFMVPDGVHEKIPDKIQPLVCASPKTGVSSWQQFLMKYSFNDTVLNNYTLQFTGGVRNGKFFSWRDQVQSLCVF